MSAVQVSIVVPFHNEEPFIERSLEAMLAQDFPADRYEIIFVDNNSTDRSAEIVRRYPRVKLLTENEPGDFAARNRGLSEASGDIVAFTDSDTAPAPEWVGNIVQAMEDPAVGVLVGTVQFDSDSLALALMADYEAEKNEYIFSSRIPEIYYGYTCNLAARRELFETLGPFPHVFRNADVAFVRRVVDERSCDAVIYARDVRVRRLEVSTLRAYLAKLHRYGRDLGNYGAVANARPLNARERIAVFRSAARRRAYSPAKTLTLLALLVIGLPFYEFGRLRGA